MSHSTKPTREAGNGVHSDYTERHPAYGMVSVSRVHGGRESLFGSSIQHSDFVTVRISTGERVRNLNRDWYHDDSVLLEFEMSPAQWAELITTMNIGCGTPCTLRSYRDGDKLVRPSYPDFTDVRSEIRDEFEQHTERVSTILDKAYEATEQLLQAGKAPTKGQMKELLGLIFNARQDIGSNMPFVTKQFHEQMDKTMVEAKAEIEQFVTRMVQETGLQALSDPQNRPIALPETTEKENTTNNA